MEVLVVILNDNNVREVAGIVSWSQDTEQWTYSVSDSTVEAVFRVVKERGYALQRVSVQTARAIIDAMQNVGPENEGFLYALEDELSLKTRFLEFRDASTEQPLERRPKSPRRKAPWVKNLAMKLLPLRALPQGQARFGSPANGAGCARTELSETCRMRVARKRVQEASVCRAAWPICIVFQESCCSVGP